MNVQDVRSQPCSRVILTRKRRCRPGPLPPDPGGISDSVLLLQPASGSGGQSSWTLFGRHQSCAFDGVLMLGEEREGLGLTQSLEIKAHMTGTTICPATGD